MENVDQNLGNTTNGGALSIYGQSEAAMDDFPVLKAFQQYIDAEQSKSRKRMILLCMFFGALMTILVSIFVFMLAQMNRDKQHVNDQLIQFLMKERERPLPAAAQPVPIAQPTPQPATNPAQDAALKAMTETLSALQKQIAEQKKAAEEEAAAAPAKAELERARRAAQETESIRRAQEQLKEEKRRLADEKERLRQQEIERQRRRLYPDYYQKQEQGARAPEESPSRIQPPSPNPLPKRRQLSDQDIDDILREVDAVSSEQSGSRSQETGSRSKKKEKKSEERDRKKNPDKPIEYFSDSEYILPVTVNGEDTGYSIPFLDKK